MATVWNNRGFSLIEMMIALVILAFTLLAMFATLGSTVSVNLSNDARNLAIRLTTQTAEVIQGLAFTDPLVISGTYTRDDGSADQDLKGFPKSVQNIRGFQQTYAISWTVSDLSDNLKQVDIIVTYTDPKEGTSRTNNSVIYKHKAL